jgi:AMIN domain-containing protein
MRRSPKNELCAFLLAGFALSALAFAQDSSTAAVRRVQVLDSKDAVEIEIEASDRLVPQTRVLTAPDRLIVDFPNAVPGKELRSQSINRGQVTSVRVGLFQAKPPVTRVVLDLKTAQSYQVFPYGRTVIIKVTGDANPGPIEVDDFPPIPSPGLVNTSFSVNSAPLETGPNTKPSLDVLFRDGLLTIRSNKTSLSEVLFAVRQRTGADIAVAAGAERELVVADIGPAPAAEVIARLLNGSRFNFLIDRVILTPRGQGGAIATQPAQEDDQAEVEVPQIPNAPVANIQPPPNQPLPRTPTEMKSSPDDDGPD